MNLQNFIKYATFLNQLPSVSNLDVEGYDFDQDQTMNKLLEYIYEWSYKYSAVNMLDIPEARKSRMLSKIDDKISPYIDVVADVLKKTYDSWLFSHAISDANQWAQNRFSEFSQEGKDELFQSLWGEFDRYEPGLPDADKIEKIVFALSGISELHNWYHEILQDDIDNLEEQKEGYDSEEFATDMAYFLERISNISDADIVEYFINYGYDVHMVCDLLVDYIGYEEVAIALYRELVFPVWYGHWEYSGIDEIRDNNENISNELSALNSQTFLQKTATLSAALNGVHVTGDMLDHVQNKFYDFAKDVSVDSLNTLSNSDENTIAQWENELKEGL